MSDKLIGGDQWRKVMDNFRSKYGRWPNKKERKFIAKSLGFHLDKVKTKGRATDYTSKHALESDVRASSAVHSYVGKRTITDDETKPAPAMYAPEPGGFHLYMAGRHKAK